MLLRSPHLLLPILCALSFAPSLAAAQQNTRLTMTTSLGAVELELFDSLRPVSVQNFLNYVSDGDYDDSIVHRSVPGFVIQGGGFRVVEGQVAFVPTDPPFVDIPGPSNQRGTIAMAEGDEDENPETPSTATSQWFISLGDNSHLDPDFTVFGQVTSGMSVVDAIAALPIRDLSISVPAWTDIPLKDLTTAPIDLSNLVLATLPEPSGPLMQVAAIILLTSLQRRRAQPLTT